MSRQFLVEMEVYDPALPGTRTLRYATGVGFTSPPLDGTPNVTYEPRLVKPASMALNISNGKVQGTGEVVLRNNDKALDALYAYQYDGRALRMLVGDPDDYPTGPLSNAFQEVLYATMIQPTDFDDTIRIPLRAATYSLDQLLTPDIYAGTGDTEGGADVKGKTKPMLLGLGINIPLVLLDATKLLYQVAVHTPNDGRYDALGEGVMLNMAVRDQGVALVNGGNYANMAAILATAPAAGNYRILRDKESVGLGTFLRLGSTPVGSPTMDVSLRNSADGGLVTNTFHGLLSNLNAFHAAFVDNPVYANDTADIPYLNPNGFDEILTLYYSDTPTTLEELLIDILRTIRGWLVFYPRLAATGKRLIGFRFFRDPTTAPVNDYDSVELHPTAPYFTVDGGNAVNAPSILQFKRVMPLDKALGIPSWRVNLKWGRVWTVQETDLAAAATAARRSYVGNEYRDAVAEDAAVKTTWPLANNDEITTVLADESQLGGGGTSAPTTEAARQLALFKVRRDFFDIRVKVPESELVMISQVMVGDPMTVQNYPRFGCTSSRKFLVMGIDIDFATSIINALIWG